MSPGTGRQAYLDRVRGLAVLVMIEAHVLDGWTRVADRHRVVFRYAIVLAGFAAPLFLFVAGISLVLSAESKYRKTGDAEAAWRAVHRRGWQIFGLALLFRLQSYVLTAGYNPVDLLKVDILNVMGPAIAVAALIGLACSNQIERAFWFAAAAVAVAMLAPIVRTTSILSWLPNPIEWYFRPSPGRTNFTLFPWSGFVFAGAVVGVAVNGLRPLDHAARLQRRLALLSGALALAAYACSFLPSIYRSSDFWTTSPTFFFLRCGLIALLLPLAYWWEKAPWRGMVSRWSPVEELGKASLFVYWIHVEMVYGFIARPLRRNLSFEAAVGAYVLFSAFLLGVVLLRNRLVTGRKAAPMRATGASTASI